MGETCPSSPSGPVSNSRLKPRMLSNRWASALCRAMMSSRQEELGNEEENFKQENDFYSIFLLPVPEDRWPPQGSVAQTGDFQVWKRYHGGVSLSCTPLWKPGAGYAGAARQAGSLRVEGKICETWGCLVLASSHRVARMASNSGRSEDRSVPFSGLHQPLPPICELKQENAELRRIPSWKGKVLCH